MSRGFGSSDSGSGPSPLCTPESLLLGCVQVVGDSQILTWDTEFSLQGSRS